MFKSSIELITSEEIDIDKDYVFCIDLDKETEQKLFLELIQQKFPNIRSITIYRNFDQNSNINECIQTMFETTFPDKCEHFGLIRNRPLRCMNTKGYATKNNLRLFDQDKHDTKIISFLDAPVQDPYEISHTDFTDITVDYLDKYISGLTTVSSSITQSLTLGSFLITPSILNILLCSFKNCPSISFFYCQFTEDFQKEFKIDDVEFKIQELCLYYPVHSTNQILESIICEMSMNQSMVDNLSLIKYLKEDHDKCPTLYNLSSILAKYGFHVRVKSFTKKSHNKYISFGWGRERRFNKRSWDYPCENGNPGPGSYYGLYYD